MSEKTKRKKKKVNFEKAVDIAIACQLFQEEFLKNPASAKKFKKALERLLKAAKSVSGHLR